MHRVAIALRAAVPAIALALTAVGFAQEDRSVLRIAMPFDRTSTELATSPGQNMAEACPKAMAMHPYAHPHAWPDARATLRLDQTATSTAVAIHLTGVRPHTRFSAWVLPAATPSNAAEARELPLSPRHVPAGLPQGNPNAADPPARGSDDPVDLGNDVWSDARGNATFTTRLPFPLVEETDTADAATPFELRIASHCADQEGRTLAFGPRQAWFQWRTAPAMTRAD